MAFLPIYDEDIEKKQVDQGGARMTPMAAGPAAAGGAPAAAPEAPAPSPGTAQGSGPFVNFARYIDANRGVADQTAQSVAGTVDKSASAAQKGLQGAQATFQQGLTAGSPFGVQRGATAGARPISSETRNVTTTPYVAPAPIAAPFASSPRPGVLQQAQQGVPQKGPAAGQISTDEARKRGAQTYTGPTGLAVSDQLRADTRNAAGQLAQTADDGGREALIRDQYGRGGGYSGGSSKMDAALTGAVGGNRFRDLRNKYGDLAGALEGGERSARSQATQAAASTSAQAAGYRSQVDKLDAAEREREKARADAEAAKANAPKPYSYDEYAASSSKDFTGGNNLQDGLGLSQEEFAALSPADRAELQRIESLPRGFFDSTDYYDQRRAFAERVRHKGA